MTSTKASSKAKGFMGNCPIDHKPITAWFARHRHISRFTKLGCGLLFLDQTVFSEQRQQDLRALFRGSINAGIAFPMVGSCVYDYVTTLKPLTYATPEYMEARKGCHERSAERILYLATKCGGIYFKAGQYLGTLERIVPKQYTQKLKQLQDSAPQVPLSHLKITYELDH